MHGRRVATAAVASSLRKRAGCRTTARPDFPGRDEDVCLLLSCSRRIRLALNYWFYNIGGVIWSRCQEREPPGGGEAASEPSQGPTKNCRGTSGASVGGTREYQGSAAPPSISREPSDPQTPEEPLCAHVSGINN